MADNNDRTSFKDDKNFIRDVNIAKVNYRKKRFMWFLVGTFCILMIILVRMYFFIQDKNELEKKIQEQENKIQQLEKDNKANEVVINKLRDSEFISDLIRAEYAMSYPGEIIFNLPIKENFMENAIKSIMNDNLENNTVLDETKQIDEDKIKSKINKIEENKKKEEEKNNEE